MANKQAYPNQSVGFELEGWGPGGMPPTTFIILSGSATIDGGSPITGTIVGTTVYITIPANQSLGTVTLALSWSQNLNGVISDQGPIDYLVDIVAAPTGSSQSFVPASPTRQCMRLVEPDDRTVEQINDAGTALTIYVYSTPYSLLRSVASNLPSSGPDVVSFAYMDTNGNPGTLAINCSLWMSDGGYCVISADNGTQFLIASINAIFWQTNAQVINTRNANAVYPILSPCANASRYGWPNNLPNQLTPTLWIFDGRVIDGSSSSML